MANKDEVLKDGEVTRVPKMEGLPAGPVTTDRVVLAISMTREQASAVLKILDRDRFGEQGALIRKEIIVKEFQPDEFMMVKADALTLPVGEEPREPMDLLEGSLSFGDLVDPTMAPAWLKSTSPEPRPGIVVELEPGLRWIRVDGNGPTTVRAEARVCTSTKEAYTVLNRARRQRHPEWKLRDVITNEILDSATGGLLRRV